MFGNFFKRKQQPTQKEPILDIDIPAEPISSSDIMFHCLEDKYTNSITKPKSNGSIDIFLPSSKPNIDTNILIIDDQANLLTMIKLC